MTFNDWLASLEPSELSPVEYEIYLHHVIPNRTHFTADNLDTWKAFELVNVAKATETYGVTWWDLYDKLLPKIERLAELYEFEVLMDCPEVRQ